MTSTPPLPAPTSPRGQVKVWGSATHPKWSVTVADGITHEELVYLVDEAVSAFHLAGERLAQRRTPTVHVPPNEERQ